jgi:hypothetical protein
VLDNVIGLKVDLVEGELAIIKRVLGELDDRGGLIEFEVEIVFDLKLFGLKGEFVGSLVFGKVYDFNFALVCEVLLEVEGLGLGEGVEFGEKELGVLAFGVVKGVRGDFVDFCDLFGC